MSFLDQIEKEFGQSDDNQDVSNWLSTGLMQLNKVISGKYHGGFPVGRITEIYGKESCGKTALATVALAETQKQGGYAVFLDHEHSFSMSRAKQFGLVDDKDKWLYKKPLTAQESFKIIEFVAGAVRKENPDKMVTIVVDSVASMVTKAQQETAFGEEKMNTKADLSIVMSFALPKLAQIVNNTNITLIFLNQTRDNVGVMYGEKTKTPGGNAMRFYCSTRIELTKIGQIKDKTTGEALGDKVRARGKKNKVAPPHVEGEYNSDYGMGIDFVTSHIDFAQSKGLLGGSKGWVEYDDKKYRVSQLAEIFRSNADEYEKFLESSFVDE